MRSKGVRSKGLALKKACAQKGVRSKCNFLTDQKWDILSYFLDTVSVKSLNVLHCGIFLLMIHSCTACKKKGNFVVVVKYRFVQGCTLSVFFWSCGFYRVLLIIWPWHRFGLILPIKNRDLLYTIRNVFLRKLFVYSERFFPGEKW